MPDAQDSTACLPGAYASDELQQAVEADPSGQPGMQRTRRRVQAHLACPCAPVPASGSHSPQTQDIQPPGHMPARQQQQDSGSCSPGHCPQRPEPWACRASQGAARTSTQPSATHGSTHHTQQVLEGVAEGHTLPCHHPSLPNQPDAQAPVEQPSCPQGTQAELSQPPQHSQHSHSQRGKAQAGPRWRQRLSSPLAVLLNLAVLVQCVTAQQVLCPCLPLPGTTGCNSTQVSISTTSSSVPGAAFAQCMPAPQYDSRWGALYVRTCWNMSCYPTLFANSVLTTTLTNFTGGNALPAGVYTVRFNAPAATGGNAVTGTFLYGNNPAVLANTTAANGTTVTVPATGLATLTVSWSYPSTLTTGNWGDLTFGNLNTVETDVVAPSPPAPPSTDPCADIAVQTDPDTPISCPDGMVRVWVWSNVTVAGGLANGAQYEGLNYTSQTGVFPKPTPRNITRCLAKPYYDPYSQQLVWNLTWSLGCYSALNGTTPYVIVTEPFEPSTLDYMRLNTTYALTVATNLQGSPSLTSPLVMPVVEFGDSNRTNQFNVSIFGGNNKTFVSPAAGITNVSLGVIIQSPFPRVANGSATFFLQSIPYKNPDPDSLADSFQIVRYGALGVVPGVLDNATFSTLDLYMGYGASIYRGGWYVTAQLLFRDYSIVYNCQPSILDALLTTIAGSVGIPRYLLNATCVQILPGSQNQFLLPQNSFSTATVPTLPLTTGLCADARIAVNVSYTVAGSDAPLTGALSVLSTGIRYALASYDTSLYCTAPLTVGSIASIEGVTTTETDYDKTAGACSSALNVTLNVIGTMVAAAGLTIQILSTSCSGAYNCVDCWPYSIPQWAIVMMACAALLLVVVVLAVRLKIVQRQEDSKPVPAGVLDVRRTALAVQARQMQQRLEEEEADRMADVTSSDLLLPEK